LGRRLPGGVAFGSFSSAAYGCRAAAPTAASARAGVLLILPQVVRPWRCRNRPCSKLLIVEILLEETEDLIAFWRLFRGLLYKTMGPVVIYLFQGGFL
jgi:hypothetical protein